MARSRGRSTWIDQAHPSFPSPYEGANSFQGAARNDAHLLVLAFPGLPGPAGHGGLLRPGGLPGPRAQQHARDGRLPQRRGGEGCVPQPPLQHLAPLHPPDLRARRRDREARGRTRTRWRRTTTSTGSRSPSASSPPTTSSTQPLQPRCADPVHELGALGKRRLGLPRRHRRLHGGVRRGMEHEGLGAPLRRLHGADGLQRRDLDKHLLDAHGQILEFDRRYARGRPHGHVRPFVYWNQARMGNYADALASPDIADRPLRVAGLPLEGRLRR